MKFEDTLNFDIILANLTNPTLLFFILGIVAVYIKSDLELPSSTSKFISLYLLFAIGFKGGQELAHGELNSEVFKAIIFGIGVSVIIPLYTFFILKKRVGVQNAGAIAAAYGSVSAVTFIATTSFIENLGLKFDGYMVAVMALMETPAIIVGVMLMKKYDSQKQGQSMKEVIHHAATNGSVVLLVGSLIIGAISDQQQADAIKPFTTDIFKGFLALFLLEMGMVTARRLSTFFQNGWFAFSFAIIIPLVNGLAAAYLSGWVTDGVGNRLILSILAASASYIAVPAAMKIAAPDSDPGLYIPMALGITFPFNITVGLPLYLSVINL